MNLADAIRQAAQESRPAVVNAPLFDANAEAHAPSEAMNEITPKVNERNEASALKAEQAASLAPVLSEFAEEAKMPEQPHAAVLSGNVVRLELFLGADQINHMLRAIMAGHHSVMTLREAAHYLRIPSQALERMAQEGEVPAFTIDARWRFPKIALDEWLAAQSVKPQENSSHVA